MGIVIGWCWAAVIAVGVYRLVDREARRRAASDDELDRIGVLDPGSAAAFTFFVAVLAPFVLWKHRGVRGFFEGLGLLLGGATGAILTSVGLMLLRG